jgi:hypothetical protein
MPICKWHWADEEAVRIPFDNLCLVLYIAPISTFNLMLQCMIPNFCLSAEQTYIYFVLSVSRLKIILLAVDLNQPCFSQAYHLYRQPPAVALDFGKAETYLGIPFYRWRQGIIPGQISAHPDPFVLQRTANTSKIRVLARPGVHSQLLIPALDVPSDFRPGDSSLIMRFNGRCLLEDFLAFSSAAKQTRPVLKVAHALRKWQNSLAA